MCCNSRRQMQAEAALAEERRNLGEMSGWLAQERERREQAEAKVRVLEAWIRAVADGPGRVVSRKHLLKILESPDA